MKWTALFALIRRLTVGGIAVIYVSHRMKEILAIATRVLVLRDGQIVGERLAAETSEADLVRMMVGRDLARSISAPPFPGRTVLSVENVGTADVRTCFDVHAGEVVVLAGLVGAGRTELARAIIGDVPLPPARSASTASRCRCARRGMRSAPVSALPPRNARRRRC